nr:DNA internalization-related competence protein ComEC/Rec2 [uncultured Aminipila sp.]
MRRPAVFICGAYILGMAMELFLRLNQFIILIIAACSIIAMIVSMHFYKTHRLRWNKKYLCLFFIAFTVGIFGAVQYSYQSNKIGILEKNQGEYLKIQGKVISVAEKDEENHKIIVVVKNLDGFGNLPSKEKILVNMYGPCPEYYKLQGNIIQTIGFIELPTARRNPKTFDYKMYLKTKGISTIMSVMAENIQVSSKTNNHYLNYLSEMKYIFKCNIYRLFDEQLAGLLMGMIFGDNSGLSEELYESFQKNGICHVLAVSGLHIGALYVCVNAILGGRKKIKFYIISVMILFFYASLANFSPSVMRAVLMITLHIFSKYMNCRYDMFTSGVITMSVMLCFNPLSLINLGFQLSFLAIFTLAVILPAAQRICDKSITPILVIQAGMAPISAFAFNYFSFSAFLANIPVIFIAGLLIPLGMLLLLFSTIAASLPDLGMVTTVVNSGFQITGVVVEFFSKLLLLINDLAFIDNLSYKYVISPPLWTVLLYYGTLFFISSESFRIMWQRKHYKQIFRFGITIICVTFILGNSLKDGFEHVQLTFVDVGQGDCLLIKTPEGQNVLIDSGGSSQYDVGKKLLLPFLLKNGVKEIDMAIITHLHTDHVGGLCSLSKELPVKKVGIYEGNSLISDKVEERVGVSAEHFVYLTKGQSVQIGKDLEIKVLYPSKKSFEEYSQMMENEKDENATCLVMKIMFKGVSVIMTGDIDTNGEMNILADNSDKCLNTDILKVAHHGSKYGSSQEFLEAVKPKIAVVQVGKNTYGHPDKKTLERIENAGAFVYRNDIQGAVGVEIKKDGKVQIRTMI